MKVLCANRALSLIVTRCIAIALIISCITLWTLGELIVRLGETNLCCLVYKHKHINPYIHTYNNLYEWIPVYPHKLASPNVHRVCTQPNRIVFHTRFDHCYHYYYDFIDITQNMIATRVHIADAHLMLWINKNCTHICPSI